MAVKVLDSDTFTRANQSGWGTASGGSAWATNVGTPTLSIASNEGHATNISSQAIMQLGSTTSQNMEGLVRCKTSATTSTRMGVALRFTASNTFYHARLSANANNLVIAKVVSGTNTDLFTTAFTVSIATFYWIRFKIIGTNLYARTWADGGSEPSTWTLTGTDSSITGAGGLGLTINATSTAVTWDFDSFTVNDGTVIYDTTYRGVLSKQTDHDTTYRSNISKLVDHDTSYRSNIGHTALKNTTFRGVLAATAVKNTTFRGKVGRIGVKDTVFRANISAWITSGQFGIFANGAGTASFTNFRATQYPDPALNLAPVLPRLGSSLVSFSDAIIPAGTAATIYTGTDGINFTPVTSGSTIPGLTTQPDPTIDIFNTDTSASYLNTSKNGGSAATAAYDLTKSRITLSGGSSGLYLNLSISSADVDALCIMDESDAGGLAWRYIDQGNFYYLAAADDHASIGTPNTMTLYRVGYSAVVESAPTLAYYRLGEASGISAIDSSGRGNTGTYTGSGVTYGQTGAIGGGDTNTAVLFNGSSGKMTLPTSVNPEAGPFTFECWIKVSAYPGGSTSILANYNTPSGNIGAGFGMNTSGQVNWTIVNGSGSFVSITSSTVTINVWHHIVGIYDGTASKFYFDGSLVGSAVSTFTPNLTDAIQVGSSPYNDYHPGYVDEVVIHTTALSSAQVTAIYNAATTTPTTQLATAAIAWPRSTAGTSPYKCIRMTMLSGVITAYFDGVEALQYTDSAPLAAGLVGLFNNGGTSRYYQLRIQPQGSYVSGTPVGDIVTADFIYTKQALSTTDPSVTPQLPSLTTSARSPQIATGALIPQLHDPSKPFAALYSTEVTSLASTSGDFFTRVADDGSVTFTERFATPAPFALYSTDLLYRPMLGGATNGVQATNSADIYRNQVIVTNTTSLVVVSNEEKIANGTDTSWNLAYPLYTAPDILVAGVTKTVGIKGVDSGKDLYWQFGNNTITQDSGAGKIPGGYILSFSYTGQYADQVTVNNYAEQAARAAVEKNSGIVVAIVDGQGMLSSNAVTYGQGLLSQNDNNDTVEIIATTSRPGAELLDVGQVAAFFFPELNINNRQLLIMKLTRTGYQLADGTVRYEYTITASDGPNLSNWSAAIGL